MAATSTRVGRPPTPQSSSTASSTLKFKNTGSVRLVENLQTEEVNKPATETSINIGSSSELRMLQAKGITSTRLEILALMDFQPLFEGSSETTSGKLLDVRHALRTIDLASAKKILAELEKNNPEAFQNALSVYTANLESARVDKELLKTAYLMKEYGARAFDYISHLSNTVLQVEPGINVGTLAYDFYPISLLIDRKSPGYNKNASILFGQLLADINMYARVGFPRTIGSKPRTLSVDSIINDPGVTSSPKTSAAYNCVRVAREMAASLKLYEVQAGVGEEKNLHSVLKSAVGSDFFNLTAPPDYSVLEKLMGFDPWQDEASKLDMDLKSKSPIRLADSLEFEGLIGQIEIPQKKILLLENGARSYSGTTYTASNALVNSAFKPANPLDFADYAQSARTFYAACQNTANILRTLYFPRFKGKTTTETSFAVGERITATSLFQESLNTFKNRFATKIAGSTYPASGKLTSASEQTQYVKNIAHIFIRDNPTGAAKILEAFIKDYNAGLLVTSNITTGAAISFAGISTASSLKPQSSSLESAKKYFRDWLRSRDFVTESTTVRFSASTSKRLAFNSSDPELLISSDSDLRASTVMLTSSTVSGNELRVSSFENTAILEVIDYGLEVLRALISRFVTISELEDDDFVWPNPGKYYSSSSSSIVEPAFPTKDQVPAPYYDQAQASSFSTKLWIPTVRELVNRFLRGSTAKTWFSGMPLAELLTGLYRIQSSIIMSGYEVLKVKRKEVPEIVIAGIPKIEYAYLSIEVPENSSESALKAKPPTTRSYATYFTLAPQLFTSLLANSITSYQQITVASVVGQENLRGGVTTPLQNVFSRTKSTISSVHEDDVLLRTSIQILNSFARRTAEFSEKAIDTFTGSSEDTNAVYELSKNLASTGNSGLDVLESLNPTQITLRDISLSRQSGERFNAYIPSISVVSIAEKLALQCLASTKTLKAPEGNNVRLMSIGVPANALQNVGLDNEFSIGIRMSDLEYSDLVFLPRNYNFDNRIYVGTNGFEKVKNLSDFNSLVSNTSFYYNDFIVKEIPGSVPKLSKQQSIKTIQASADKFDVYSNTVVSALFELYYKVLLGVEINEDTFPSVAEPIGIPLNKYAGNLTAALASLSADLAPAGSKTAEFYKTASDLTSERNSKRAIAIDGFTELDAEFVASIRNAFTTRLASAEDMRNTILKAKIFDRVLFMPVDPDEFIIATEEVSKSNFTPQTILDKYLKNGIIVPIEFRGATAYKLAPRTVAEGRMAFTKLIATLEAPSTNHSLLVPN